MKDFEVSKKSWHYRLNKLFRNEPQGTTSLCKYFWSTVLAPLKFLATWTGIIALALFLIGTFGIGLFYLVGWMFIGLLNVIHVIPDGFFNLQRGVFDWKFIPASIVIDLIGVCLYFGWNKWQNRTITKKEPKEDSLFVAYVKAKKRKICPLITFKD